MKFFPAALTALASFWFYLGSMPAGMFVREWTDCSRDECRTLALIGIACSAVLVWLFLSPKATARRRQPALKLQNTLAPSYSSWRPGFSFQSLSMTARSAAITQRSPAN